MSAPTARSIPGADLRRNGSRRWNARARSARNISRNRLVADRNSWHGIRIPGRVSLRREIHTTATLFPAEESLSGARIASPFHRDGAGRMTRFFRKTDGVVTVEWVAIAAVMVLAAI